MSHGGTVRPRTLIFLPGASGRRDFWRPVADRLGWSGSRVFLGWPGFAGVAPDPRVGGFDDLAALVLDRITEPCALIAQSMGGIVAVQAAARRPELVTHLALAATSGGVRMHDVGAADWRPEYLAEFPDAPRWFVDADVDVSDLLPRLRMPTLLLWGDADPISPVAVGRRLQALLPLATLHVVPGAHDVVAANPAPVAAHLARHLGLDAADPRDREAASATLRPAMTADADRLATLGLASWRATYTAELSPAFHARQDPAVWAALWARRLAAGLDVIVAEAGEALLGFVTVGPSRDRDALPRTWEIQNLHVRPDRHGLGLGRRLFDAALDRARRRGATSLTLWVVVTNTKARRFYEGRGMHADGTRQDHAVDGEVLHEFRYRLAL